MYRCRNCGELIDEHQMRNFQGLCSECTRMQRQGPSVDSEICERTLWSVVMIAGIVIAVGSLGSILFALMTPIGWFLLPGVPISILVGGLLYWFGRKMKDEAEAKEYVQY